MKKWLCSVCAAAVVLGSAHMVWAQEKPMPLGEKAPHDIPLPPEMDAGMPLPPPPPALDEKMVKKMPPKAGPEERLADVLKLTPEQKEKAKEVRENGRKKIEPLMEDMRDIRKKMDEVRKENMAEFEKILTPEQKSEFEKIKAKRHEKMKKMHKKFKKGPKHHDKRAKEKAPKPE